MTEASPKLYKGKNIYFALKNVNFSTYIILFFVCNGFEMHCVNEKLIYCKSVIYFFWGTKSVQ